MAQKGILVATHGHCFDGMASAALFTHLMRKLRPQLTVRYRSCGYSPAVPFTPESQLDGEENAILDFRYTPSDRVTWYFDHHITGFVSDADRDKALSATSGPGGSRHVYYEPTYSSCTTLIRDVAKRDFGVDMEFLRELIDWADVIDAARFASAAEAASRDEPILQLASVIEHHGDAQFLTRVVPALLERPAREVARSEAIQKLWLPLAKEQERFVAQVKVASQEIGRAVLIDLSSECVETSAKFVAYALYPQCQYSVGLTRNRHQFKLSVGYNPWCGIPRTVDVAAICKRFGGGGHPSVGGASFSLNEGERARQCARSVVEELNR